MKQKRVKDQCGKEEMGSPVGNSTLKEAWRMMIVLKDEERMMDGSCGGRATLSDGAWKGRKWYGRLVFCDPASLATTMVWSPCGHWKDKLCLKLLYSLWTEPNDLFDLKNEK